MCPHTAYIYRTPIRRGRLAPHICMQYEDT
jgi:hypothetical protein